MKRTATIEKIATAPTYGREPAIVSAALPPASLLDAALIAICDKAAAGTGQPVTVLPHSLPEDEPMRRVDMPDGRIVFLWDTEQVTAEEVLSLLHRARTGAPAGQLAEA